MSFLVLIVGNSVIIPIALIGVIAGTLGGLYIYPINLVCRAFQKFRPIAIAFTHLGTPVGCLIMPYIASAVLAG